MSAGESNAYDWLSRYTTQGVLDTSRLDGGAQYQWTCVGMDGTKIVAAGTYTGSDGVGHTLLARFNSDATLDTGFGFGGIASAQFNSGATAENVAALFVNQTTHAITVAVVSGGESAEGEGLTYVGRFAGAGVLDEAFGKHTPFTAGLVAQAIRRRPDGTIVVLAGDLSGGGFRFARFTDLGAPIGTAVAGKFTSGPWNFSYDLAVDTNGGFVVAGETIPSNGSKAVMGLARYTAAGVLDTNFDGDGKKTVNFGLVGDQSATGVGFDGNAKIVVVGEPRNPAELANGVAILAARLSSTGTVETSRLSVLGGTSAVAPLLPMWRLAMSGNNFYVTSNALQNNVQKIVVAKYSGTTFDLDPSFDSDGWTLTGSQMNLLAFGVAVDGSARPVVVGYAF